MTAKRGGSTLTTFARAGRSEHSVSLQLASQLQQPTQKNPPTLTWYSTEPGHNRAVPVSREWDNLGGGRGYGRPRPVAVGARRRAAREARGGSLLWGRNNPNYTSTLTQATRGEAGGQCYLSLINLAVKSGGRCLLSTREERPFALARVAQKHDMHADMTTEARPPESNNNNNLRKNERPKSLSLATPAGTPADAPLVVSKTTRAEKPCGGHLGISAQ